MRLIVDGNALLNAALLRGVDHDGGKVVADDAGRPVQVNSAEYGVEGFFEKLLSALELFDRVPRDVVCVWDGKDSKARRRRFIPNYKVGRDKHPAVSEQINLARERCTQELKDMGATNVWQAGMEADDVIGYLCKTLRGERNTVVTVDGDLAVLVDENTDVWRLGKLNENPYGRFPHKYITLYKSLVGDSSDKIPGAHGFGDGAWVDLVRIFGVENLEELERMIVEGRLKELRENLADMPKLQKILDSEHYVTESWRAASLHIEEVNTAKRPMQILAGMVKQRKDVIETCPAGYEKWYGTKTLVTAANYEQVFARFKGAVTQSPFVALDIETASGEASDQWIQQVAQALERKEDRMGIDVLGHELVGMSLTFGQNTQHTLYMTVNHADSDNITVDQCRLMCEAIPAKIHTVIQNRSFEFSVLYRTWGDKWADNGWGGFVPNAVDTKIGASYVDENLSKGLKERSKVHLGYEQTTYEQTTCAEGPLGTLRPGGTRQREFLKEIKPAVIDRGTFERIDEDTGEILGEDVIETVVEPAVTEMWERRQYKMSELSADHVFDYGCDDTICTASLHTFYKFVMDVEHTWDVYLKVEQHPEYLTSLAFVQGLKLNLAKLKQLEQRDEESYDKAWATLRTYLMKKGWDGTHCPEFEGDIEPSDVKMCADILLDGEFTTRKRKLNAIAEDIRTQYPDNDLAHLFAEIVARNEVENLNKLVRQNFTGEPKINFGSPAQMQNLFYNVIGMRPRILNKLTARQKEDEVLSRAFRKYRTAKQKGLDCFAPGASIEALGDQGGVAKLSLTLTSEERKALISKASTDDSAVTSALALDNLGEAEKSVLKAFSQIKEIQTRRSLFYRTYRALPHWSDGRVHPNLNQCEAVTRRYSSSGPNVQQLPKRGEGVEFRQVILPHCKDAVVVSMDFSGQELRLGAEMSGDEAMTSCYVGTNLRDMHSLTAVAAAPMIWGKSVTYEEFMQMLESDDKEVKARAKALRASAKTVNFAAQYGAAAPKIAETLMTDEETAQAFLDARAAAFPKIGQWSNAVAEQARESGYAQTLMGARRHLAQALLGDDKFEASKAERQVGNFWIQGSAAEMTKLAMARMWESGVFFDGRFNAVFYAPIHDEVVFSVHKDQALEVIKQVHPMMIAPYATMGIPIVSSISLGPDFGQQIECGDYVDEARINDALKEVFAA